MNSKKRVEMTLNHKEPDRVPRFDGFWEQTVERFYDEGLENEVSDMPEIVVDGLKRKVGNPVNDYFNFDFDVLYIDSSMRFEGKILDENDEFVTLEDRYGFTVKKYKDKSASMHFISHRNNNYEEWLTVKEKMTLDHNDVSRIDSLSYFMHFDEYPSWSGFKVLYDEYRKRDKYMLYTAYGPWESTWRHHGFEQLMMSSALEPDYVKDMFAQYANLLIDILQKAIDIDAKPDGLWIMEDLGGTHTTLISNDMYNDLLKPYHKKLADFCHENDMKIFMHSCGKIESFIPDFIDFGLDVLQAIQDNTGMDVVELKKQYGDQLTFFGNIGETKLTGTLEEIEKEIKYKVSGAKKNGGYIYHSDHSIPDEVSLKNYKHIMKMLDKYGKYEE